MTRVNDRNQKNDKFELDKPIKSEKEDILGTSKISKRIARRIRNTELGEGSVMSIEGNWGDGKTSIVNMLKEELILEDKIKIMDFNPWLITNHEALIGQFFIALLDILKEEGNTKLNSLIKDYTLLLTGEADIVAGVMAILTVGSLKETALIKFFSNIISVLSKKSLEKTKNSKNIIELKNEIAVLLKRIDYKILIIIDDIDRLDNKEILLILKLVKSVADFPNIIYLLCFDKKVVVNALEESNKYDGNVYLEKIVQFPFKMPLINSYKLSLLIYSKITEIIELEELLKEENHKILTETVPLIKNIRDIKRISSYYNDIYKELGQEVNAFDLLGISTLYLIDDSIIDVIISQKDNLTYEGILKEIDYTKIISEIEQINKKEATKIINLISTMFLSFENSRKYYRTIGKEIEKEALKKILENEFNRKKDSLKQNRRITTSRYFNLYFNREVYNIEISKQRIDAILKDINKTEINNEIKQFIVKDKLKLFIEEIEIFVFNYDINIERFKWIIEILLLENGYLEFLKTTTFDPMEYLIEFIFEVLFRLKIEKAIDFIGVFLKDLNFTKTRYVTEMILLIQKLFNSYNNLSRVDREDVNKRDFERMIGSIEEFMFLDEKPSNRRANNMKEIKKINYKILDESIIDSILELEKEFVETFEQFLFRDLKIELLTCTKEEYSIKVNELKRTFYLISMIDFEKFIEMIKKIKTQNEEKNEILNSAIITSFCSGKLEEIEVDTRRERINEIFNDESNKEGE